MSDLLNIEGSGPIQLVHLIRSIGYNKDVDFLIGTITAPPPNIRVKVDNMSVELAKDDLIVAQYLTKHKRSITLTSSQVTDAMTSAGTGPHTHDITSLTISGEVEFTNELKAGERVIIAEIENGQNYVIIDRAVSY